MVTGPGVARLRVPRAAIATAIAIGARDRVLVVPVAVDPVVALAGVVLARVPVLVRASARVLPPALGGPRRLAPVVVQRIGFKVVVPAVDRAAADRAVAVAAVARVLVPVAVVRPIEGRAVPGSAARVALAPAPAADPSATPRAGRSASRDRAARFGEGAAAA